MKFFLHKMQLFLHHEAIIYIVVGCMTTAINFLVFAGVDFLLMRGLSLPGSASYKIAYVLAFVIAVVFAYWSNKFWVFHNEDTAMATVLREFAAFLAARVFSGVASFFMMIVLVDLLHASHNFAWLCTSAFNMVFNYVASKFWIFKAKESA